jgi:Domain of unknown function (DUF4124)
VRERWVSIAGDEDEDEDEDKEKMKSRKKTQKGMNHRRNEFRTITSRSLFFASFCGSSTLRREHEASILARRALVVPAPLWHLAATKLAGGWMRPLCRSLIALGALLASIAIEAQIYTCTAPDGTRIFSDERCGPDAKVVPNISTNRAVPKATTPRPKVEPKSRAELETLLQSCNAGDMAACNTWTKAGGPGSLKDKERNAEQACESGSLADCEYRYCNGGVSEECRSRVLRAAKIAGDNWYLRDTGKSQPDGSTRYDVRCVPPGVRAIRDVAVVCAAKAGPTKCMAMGSSIGQSRLDLAAAALCGV